MHTLQTTVKTLNSKMCSCLSPQHERTCYFWDSQILDERANFNLLFTPAKQKNGFLSCPSAISSSDCMKKKVPTKAKVTLQLWNGNVERKLPSVKWPRLDQWRSKLFQVRTPCLLSITLRWVNKYFACQSHFQRLVQISEMKEEMKGFDSNWSLVAGQPTTSLRRNFINCKSRRIYCALPNSH